MTFKQLTYSRGILDKPQRIITAPSIRKAKQIARKNSLQYGSEYIVILLFMCGTKIISYWNGFETDFPDESDVIFPNVDNNG